MANESDGGISPQTIPDVLIPILSTSTDNNNSSSAKASATSDSGLTTPQIPNAHIPSAPMARELIATSLDTQQRKILGNYQFGEVGGIQIGEVQAGVAGQINISPDGILAKNSSGLQYFTLSDTGLEITDGVDATIMDANGIRSTTQFQNNLLTSNLNPTTSSTSFVDIAGSSFTIVAPRDIVVFFYLTCFGDVLSNGFITDGYGVEVQLYDDVIGEVINTFLWGANGTSITDLGGGALSWTYRTLPESQTQVATLTVYKGTHNYKLQFRANGGGTAELTSYTLGYIVLGT